MRSDCIVSSVMGSDCIVDVSESYTTYDQRSIEDFDYRPYDVSTRPRIHTHAHANTRKAVFRSSESECESENFL